MTDTDTRSTTRCPSISSQTKTLIILSPWLAMAFFLAIGSVLLFFFGTGTIITETPHNTGRITPTDSAIGFGIGAVAMFAMVAWFYYDAEVRE